MKRLIKKLIKGARIVSAWIICRFLPIDKKKIIVSNFCGRGFGDNPKYVVSELISKYPNLKIVWIVKNDSEGASLPSGVIPCKKDSFFSVYHLATSKVWLDNCRKPFILYKRKKQFYMQTWHGFALKRIEKDVQSNLDSGYVKMAIKDSKCIDCIISDSDFMNGIYSGSFWYNGTIYKWGSPRNDIIISQNPHLKALTNQSFGLSEGVKTVLYAPTFRADGSLDAYSIDYMRLKRACEARFGGSFAVLVRLHPNVVERSKDICFDGKNIINASFYPDMQELLASVDVVVSDYSSLMFDFALSSKPCFQFATDISAYKGERNFYFELDKLPFSLATDNDELEKIILSFNEEEYTASIDGFFSSVGMINDGDASRKCAELIGSVCNK